MSARFIRGFLAVALPAVLSINSAYAKKPAELNAHQREGRVVLADQGIALSPVSGATKTFSGTEYPVTPGTPEAMARQFLSENAALFKMVPDTSDLVFDGTVETPVGYHVHFHQKVGEMDVEGTDTNISIDREKSTVYFAMSGYKPDPVPSNAHALLPKQNLVARASKYLNLTDATAEKKVDEVIFVDAQGKAHRATRVNVVSPSEHLWNWEVLVDSSTGKILRAKDKLAYGKALVADPNPVIKSGSIYGQGGILDNNNRDSQVLTDLLTQVDLDDITVTGGVYKLTGKYADSRELESPTNPNCDQNTPDYKATRGDKCFDMINTYYFITKQMKYFNETLGYNIKPIKYTGGQRFDAHGLGGDDNSHYNPSSGILAFGEGGVDDAQDHDVVIHELGHAVHDYITNGNLSQEDGLSEGVGDYFASSYSRQFMKADHPAFNWTFSWDGHNPFWPGRVVNNPGKYPDDLGGEVHADGEIWASAMGEVFIAIGKEAADRDMLEALSMANGSAGQNDTANAVLKADLKLFPNGANQEAIRKIFKARGYTLTE